MKKLRFPAQQQTTSFLKPSNQTTPDERAELEDNLRLEHGLQLDTRARVVAAQNHIS